MSGTLWQIVFLLLFGACTLQADRLRCKLPNSDEEGGELADADSDEEDMLSSHEIKTIMEEFPLSSRKFTEEMRARKTRSSDSSENESHSISGRNMAVKDSIELDEAGKRSQKFTKEMRIKKARSSSSSENVSHSISGRNMAVRDSIELDDAAKSSQKLGQPKQKTFIRNPNYISANRRFDKKAKNMYILDLPRPHPGALPGSTRGCLEFETEENRRN